MGTAKYKSIKSDILPTKQQVLLSILAHKDGIERKEKTWKGKTGYKVARHIVFFMKKTKFLLQNMEELLKK